MKPVSFPESNKVYNKPESMTDAECSSLDVFENEQLKISCWEFTPEERLLAIFNNRIWLHVHLNIQSPVLLSAEYPFVQSEPAEKIETIIERMIEHKVRQFLAEKSEKLAFIDNTLGITLNREQFLTEYTKFIFGIEQE